MTMSIKVTGADRVIERIGEVDTTTHLLLQGTVLKAGLDTQNRARVLCPVDLGRLRSSIRSVPVGELEAEVRTDVKYAPYVEHGTRPHMPPVEALQAWAKSHGGDAWAIALHIKKYGTRPHPFLFPAWDATRPGFLREVAEALREAVDA